MHIKHKQGPKSKQVLNHQSTKCYTKYQELIKEGIVEKDISIKCWKNANVWKKNMSCYIIRIGYTTKSALLNTTI